MLSSTCLPSASRMSPNTTRAPSRANVRASAAPCPRAPPLISATFPSSFPMRWRPPCRLRVAATHGGGAARKLQALPGVGDRRAVDLEDPHVVVEKVADIQVTAVGTEHRALGKAAHRHLTHLGNLLAVDLQHGETSIVLVEPAALGHHAGAEKDGHRDVTLRTDDEALGGVTHDHPIDHPRGAGLGIDHAHGIDVTVGLAGVPVVGADGEA